MKRCLALALIAALGLSAAAQSMDPGIAALQDRIKRAWESPVDEGIAVWNEILAADNFIMIFHNPADESKTFMIDRNDFFKLFRTMQMNNPSVRHAHTTVSLKVCGPIAYDVALLEDHKKNGIVQKSKVLNVYRRDPDGWKVLMTTSADEVAQLFK